MYNHLQNAEHNEQTSRYLSEPQKYADWVIVTSFYGALHSVRHLIATQPIDGKRQTFEALYQQRPKIKQGRHQFQVDFVSKNYPTIACEYEQLFKMSYKARYDLVQHTQQQALTAQAYAEKIQQYVLAKTEKRKA